MISIYPVMDLSILLSIHLISSIYQSSIDLHTSYSPINGHICVFSIYIYIYLQPSIYDLHSSSTSPPMVRSVLYCFGDTGLDDLEFTHQKTFPLKVARKFTWNRGKGPFQEEISKFHIPTRNFSGALKVTFRGCKRQKKESDTKKKHEGHKWKETFNGISLRQKRSKEPLVLNQHQPFHKARR